MMKVVVNILNIVTCVVSISFLVFVLYDTKLKPFVKVLRIHRSAGSNPDDTMQKLIDHGEILHALFGPKVSITSYTTAAGRTIAVACRKCGKENRLVKGFNGASCGNCKHPLVVKTGEFKATN